MRNKLGFTYIEVVVVFGILATMFLLFGGLSFRSQYQTLTAQGVESLISDLRGQQIKAMTGDSGGILQTDDYGLFLSGASYILFRGSSYAAGNTTNTTINFPDGVSATTTFSGNQVIFSKDSGEIAGYDSLNNLITISYSNGGVQRQIRLNKFATVISE